MNPEEIIINLPDSVFICQGQTATLDAGNMGALFEWVADNGFTSDQQIINVQEQGDYLVQVSNVEGCSNTAKTYVKFENRQFYATFLMSGEATMNDTIVVIELSRPQPDEIEWFIPEDFMKLVDGDSYKELIPLQTGEFTIGMKAGLSGCSETVEKRITIVPADNSTKEKTVADALIQSARLFPNPNTGQFEVEVKLAREADISADVFSMKGMRMMPTKYDYGKKDYILVFNLMQLNPGIYFVNIMVEKEIRKLKFIVN
jgi:predicted  nucleic acid-binding Zn-ribbon protein